MTSSFGIQPQRQLRSFYQAPEKPAEPAAPAEPAMVSQRRGGGVIDAQRPQKDLGLEQQVQSIQNFMEQVGKTSDVFAKEDQKKQMAKASRVYGVLAQYELETVEIGEAAKQLRKKGRPDLADQVIAQNPWFEYGLLKTKGEHAGPRTVIETQNWVNSHIDELRQIEDPTDRSKKIFDYAQTYYNKNYPDVPDGIYAGLVSPVLSKAMPKIIGAVHDEHLKFRLTQASQEGRQLLKDTTFEFGAFLRQAKRNPERRAALMSQYTQAIFRSQEEFTKKGFTKQSWVANVLEPWVKNLSIDTDKNGINDIKDENLFKAITEGLNVQIPGLGKNETLLSLIGPESGKTMEELLIQQRLKALTEDNKYEIMLDQMEGRKVKDFNDNLRFTVEQLLDGKTGEDLLDARNRIYNQIEDARLGRGDGTITLYTRDPETNKISEINVPIPTGYSLKNARDLIFTEGAPVDPRVFEYDKNKFKQMVNDNPKAEIPEEIKRRYAPGSPQYKWFADTQRTAADRFATNTFSTEIGDLERKAAEVVSRLNKQKMTEAANKVFVNRQKRLVEGQYKNVLGTQKEEAKNYARIFARGLINDPNISAEDLKNPNWWDTYATNRLEALIESNDFLNDPTQLFPGAERATTEDQYLGAIRQETGKVDKFGNPETEVIETQQLLSPRDFLKANEKLIKKGELSNYYKTQPMIQSATFDNIAQSAIYGQPFSSEALQDLKQGYDLASKLTKDLTLSEFLQGQSENGVFSGRGADGKPIDFKSFKDKPQFVHLRNSLADAVGRPKGTTVVKWHQDGLQHSHNPGAVDFWLQDKNGNMNVPFAAPVKMEIIEVDFEEGGYGNYARGRVMQDSGGLKIGDIVSIGHAKSFGSLKKGDVLTEGSLWGFQHTEQSYRVGYDQAAGPGAGVHLDISITRGGRRLSQPEVRKIFLNTLSNRLPL